MSSPDVAMLVDMGFTLSRVEKALEVTGNKGVEPAMEWLLAHPEEIAPIDPAVPGHSGSNVTCDPQTSTEDVEPGASTEAQDAKSLKCDVCGKLFKSTLEVEYHATKSGHDSFSESLEEKKPMTEEERKEKMRILEEKMKQKRKEREENEKKEAIEKEKCRIKSGKEMAEARRKLEELEMKKILEQRRREKEEDKQARQAIREKIEADKQARRLKYQVQQPETPAPAPVVQSPPVNSAPKRDYNKTKLAIRLTNGQTLTQTFGSKEQLSAVRLFVEINRTDTPGSFDLLASFPRRVFTDEDYDTPLDYLGLVPSAVVIVQKKAANQ